uniref:Uncharacterized protein n=1 Tax=Candidatus Methanogaster sp. ANME-2c ERB4 TaxID=2759911 RepID=A0A7G9YRJ2_9EURY|nr:hypothetical protein FICJDHNH_00009 [Methanosarcinales archaeon ANME-2c ERB4]QNO43976.1 hypothetical protein AECFJODE_00029 [Methanosarcinales archaeon ANME-2c ERB4]QNO50626.1 hypothetical protein JEJMEHHC_00007 [Methanosarcinales archaeon ANME-2c ERB4]
MNTGKVIDGAVSLAVAIMGFHNHSYARSYSQLSWRGNFRHSGIGTANRQI